MPGNDVPREAAFVESAHDGLQIQKETGKDT
jgi:hypothetical protein